LLNNLLPVFSLDFNLLNMSAISDTATVPLTVIDQERAHILKQNISAILRCDNARSIFAQVIDGLPVVETYELPMRQELLSRIVPSEQSMALSQQFCGSGDKFNKLELNAKARNEL
jgi:hypothetical protein